MEALGRTFLNSLEDSDIRLHVNLLAETVCSEHVRATLGKGNRDIVESFAGYVREAQARGEVDRHIDALAIAQFMCSLYHGFIALKQLTPEVDSNRYFDAVMTVFRGGFFTPAARAPVGRPLANS
jgi:hypothetical protein